jgi:hypothetical protein
MTGMKLPDELPEAPYEVVAFRVNHFHPPDDAEDDDEGTLLLEIGARLPGTEAELVVPLEMTPETVIGLIDELIHQYRCLEYGFADEENEEQQ